MGLIVDHLTKKFGEKTAVDSLSFTMDSPGVFGLLGTNGAGKTTTIRNILGIMTPDAGSAEWNGTRITRETLAYGYLPEERGIYMKTKVLEQLVYFGMLRGMKKRSSQKSSPQLYGASAGDRVSKYSGRKIIQRKSAENTAYCSGHT